MIKQCEKVKFTLARVTMILAFIKKKSERSEKRYYKCEKCNSYHLTSMSQGKFDKQKELFEKFLKEKKEREDWQQKISK